jgi:hypothetical protein
MSFTPEGPSDEEIKAMQPKIDKANQDYVDEVEKQLAELKQAIGNTDLNAVGFKTMSRVALYSLRRYSRFHPSGKAFTIEGLIEGAEGESKEVTALIMAMRLLKGGGE